VNSFVRELPTPELLLISDTSQSQRPITEVFVEAMAGGCRWFMVREKGLSTAELTSLTKMLTSALGPSVSIIVNGDIIAAQASGADGVHLQTIEDILAARVCLFQNKLIGYSAHSISDAEQAAQAGADYVTLSPVFESRSKPGYSNTIGLSGLRDAANTLNIPIIALAGISVDNAPSVLSAGVRGIAVMGEIMRANNPRRLTKQILAVFEGRESPTRQIGRQLSEN
jgi:thiamine-phosphate pyrophosphorylase